MSIKEGFHTFDRGDRFTHPLHRLLLLVGITTGSVGPALADLSEALVNAVAGAFTPAGHSSSQLEVTSNLAMISWRSRSIACSRC